MRRYRLKNLDCATCAEKLELELGRLETVRSASIDFSTLTLNLDADDVDQVRRTISATEPEVLMVDAEDPGLPGEVGETVKPADLARMIAAAALFGLGLLVRNRPGFPGWLPFAVAYAAAGWRVIVKAGRKILKGDPFDENFLMTVATLGAVAIGALPEAAGTMIFYLVGEFLQGLAVRDSRRSVKSLLSARPDHANLRRGSTYERVSPSEVAVGDIVSLMPGERIPVDGIVEAGESSVDASALTGESLPRSAVPGSIVLSGMINSTGLLEVRSTRAFAESSIARVMDLVENATHMKAKTELFFSSFARYYTPVVVAAALLIALIPPLFLGASLSVWIYRALVVLVVSCPCALVISIPLAYFVGIGAASRRGILVKGSAILDALALAKTVVFDKTGTLTRGSFKVLEIRPVAGIEPRELLDLAAKAEAGSNHPIAACIRAAAGDPTRDRDPGDFTDFAGRGVRYVSGGREILVGNGELLSRFGVPFPSAERERGALVAVDGRYLGGILVGDEIKHEAPGAIRALRSMGLVDVAMLTGDSEAAAASAAAALGIRRWKSGLLPEGKVEAIEGIEAQTGPAIFVGDGINDAPVLARASVGVSMGSLGSDAAVETADVVLMNDSIASIPTAVAVARKTRRILFENVAFALAVKTLFALLGFFGIATMWEAVFGDMGVAVIAIFNALRILSSPRRLSS